jgi:nitronate monooxygenase
VGRKCLCNSLLANVGYPQVRNGVTVEPALVTIGDDLNTVAQFLAPGRESYSAADVVRSLLSQVRAEPGMDVEPVPTTAVA